MTTPKPSLSRAIAIGLTSALLLGSVFLAVRAAMLSHANCDGLLAEECALEEEIAAGLFRLHGLGAAGLLLVSGGLVWLLRRNPETR